MILLICVSVIQIANIKIEILSHTSGFTMNVFWIWSIYIYIVSIVLFIVSFLL